MAIAPSPTGLETIDPATGRLLPLTDEQSAALSDALTRALDDVEQITDESDTDERWSEIYRNIDAERPHRPLFRGMY